MTSINSLAENIREQKITKRITVAASSTGSADIPIPSDASVFLKGYGYTWYQNQTYVLSTGIFTFPVRSDQEGSVTQPVIYGNPYPCPSGSTLKLTITNNDFSSHVYDVVFYLLSTEILNIQSAGSDLTLNTNAEKLGYQYDTTERLAVIQTTNRTLPEQVAQTRQASFTLTSNIDVFNQTIRFQWTTNSVSGGSAETQLYRIRNGVSTAVTAAINPGGAGDNTTNVDINDCITGDTYELWGRQIPTLSLAAWRNFGVYGIFITAPSTYLNPINYTS